MKQQSTALLADPNHLFDGTPSASDKNGQRVARNYKINVNIWLATEAFTAFTNRSS